MDRNFYVQNTPPHLAYPEWPTHFYIRFEEFIQIDAPGQHRTSWCCGCKDGPLCKVKPIRYTEERQ